MKLNFQWKKKTGMYQNGESLYLNTIKIGGYDWNVSRTKDDHSVDYEGGLLLPSLANRYKRIYGNEPEDIKAELERIATSWFKQILE